MEKLVIYGGSFDPAHNGHLRIARAASLLLNADVVFVPAKAPRWKHPGASALDRLEMLKLALSEDGSGAFSIDECELTRPGEETFTSDTIRYFKKKYPRRQLILLIGADQVNLFGEWHEADFLAKTAKIVYVPRNGVEVNPDAVARYHMGELPYRGAGSVSSSAIRELHSVDIPRKVNAYIASHHLYYMPHLESYLSKSRLAHSFRVAELAYAIAKRNYLPNAGEAYIAGLLHDIGKGLPEREARAIVRLSDPDYAEYPSYAIHQFTGAYLAQNEFGVTSDSILDAIRYHCTGKAHMPPLTKIIYSADKIEPGRGYDSSKLIEACLASYYPGFLKVLAANDEFIMTNGENCKNALSESCRMLYLGER